MQVSLAESRPAAALSFARKNDLETERLENADRRDPNFRLVITDESVIPQNDLAARSGPVARLSLNKPVIESFLRIVR